MPEKYLPVDGVPTRLLHTGPTTLPDVPPALAQGETVVCLHGAGGNGNTFAALLEGLAAAHSPVAFDQPGHGRSGGLDSLGSVERMAGFTRAFVDKLGIERPVLLGHSLGGAVGLEYTLTWPSDVRALILCGSAARFDVPDAYLEFMRRVTEGKERRPFNREALSPSTPDEVVHRLWMEDAKTDPRAAYGDLVACREWNAEDRLCDVGVPALVVVGEDEVPMLREQAELLGSRIPGAREATIPKAGHVAHFEQPAAVADAVLAFLSELPR